MRLPASLPWLLAGGILLLGVGASWVGPDSDWSARCPPALSQEGSGAHVRASIWPPGTRCSGTRASGDFVESTYIPWREWLFCLGAAALVGGLSAAAMRRPRRRRRLGPGP